MCLVIGCTWLDQHRRGSSRCALATLLGQNWASDCVLHFASGPPMLCDSLTDTPAVLLTLNHTVPLQDFGLVIEEVLIGSGPCGELRFPVSGVMSGHELWF